MDSYLGRQSSAEFDFGGPNIRISMFRDGLARAPGVSSFQKRFDAQVAEFMEGAEKVLLLKPETFMNLSGHAVRQAVDFYQVSLTDLLVVCDRAQAMFFLRLVGNLCLRVVCIGAEQLAHTALWVVI